MRPEGTFKSFNFVSVDCHLPDPLLAERRMVSFLSDIARSQERLWWCLPLVHDQEKPHALVMLHDGLGKKELLRFV